MRRVIWLEGYPGSGKTTLATALANKLIRHDIRPIIIDGDRLRDGLCIDLGWDDKSRQENLRRAACLIDLVAEQDREAIFIGAFITPKETYREMLRCVLGKHGFFEVFVFTPYLICAERKPELYKKAFRGSIPDFTGLDSAFEDPVRHDCFVPTFKMAVPQCVEYIFNKWRELG